MKLSRILLTLTAFLLAYFSYFYYDNFNQRRYILEIAKYKLFGNYKSLDSIEKIYILNLDKYPDRLAKVLKVAKKFKLKAPIQRFSGIYGKDVKYINLSNNEVIHTEDIIKTNTLLSGKFQILCNDTTDDFQAEFDNFSANKGVIGCFCSHREIWKDIIKNRHKKVLVL